MKFINATLIAFALAASTSAAAVETRDKLAA
jgi:hypothetical protein